MSNLTLGIAPVVRLFLQSGSVAVGAEGFFGDGEDPHDVKVALAHFHEDEEEQPVIGQGL